MFLFMDHKIQLLLYFFLSRPLFACIESSEGLAQVIRSWIICGEFEKALNECQTSEEEDDATQDLIKAEQTMNEISERNHTTKKQCK